MTTKTAIYTLGYEGETADVFWQKVEKSGVQRVIDVRRNPVSRKPGFSKKAMAERAKSLGLEYCHLPALGIASELRAKIETDEDSKRLLDRYENELLAESPDSLKEAGRMIQDLPSALLCFEADPAHCHRSRLARKLSGSLRLPVVHL